MSGAARGDRLLDLPIGTPRELRSLRVLVAAVLVLNGLDAAFTLVWVRTGLAPEANPLMRELIEGHPLAFLAVKLGGVAAASWLLWRHRRRALAVIGLFAVFVVYYALLLWHLGFASFLLEHRVG